jgi:7,8-dihydropterin-6-yl-methyl-4-(beta-D-ribofuranosyl)aminobenzene 5'-phosphate synthase
VRGNIIFPINNGITNAVETAREIFNLPVKSVIGGFHTNKCSETEIDFIADYFKKISPEFIGCCHCTGIEKYSDFKRILGDKVFYNQTGNIFEI